MKKKQPDFQKTKLRVGRQLPKGQNVTDTSFKTRKIITHEQLKAALSAITLKELLSHLSHNNVSAKKENLHKLNNYVVERKDSLSLYFPEILKKVGGILLEDDPGVREVAITVIHSCLTVLSDAQINCFFTAMTSFLNCMMTHFNNSIRKDSLKLLDKILDTHPNVICQSVQVISSMLNMISSAVHVENKSKDRRKRKLDEHISSKITSQDWRIEVLSRIQSFLNAMLKDGKDQKADKEEQEVHWDGKKPLYLPLYRHGGLQPQKQESASMSSTANKQTMQEFKNFMYEFIPLLSQIIKGETSFKQKPSTSSASIVEPAAARLLNIVSQVLSSLGEWTFENASFLDEKDPELNQLLSNVICRQLLKFFPYAHNSAIFKKKHPKKDDMECLMLNLAVCHLYAMFILDTEHATPEMEETVMAFLKALFTAYGCMSIESVLLMIKISKLVMKSKTVNDSYKNAVLLGLYGVLDCTRLSPSFNSIYSFFMEISLNYDYRNLLATDGMETWFRFLLKEMVFMIDTDAKNQSFQEPNEKFLKYIRLICVRKYAYFMDILNSMSSQLIGLLFHGSEEYQLTAIHLICSLDSISPEFFQDLCETMSNPSFSQKSASRLIHFLHGRFSGPNVPKADQVNFVQFLLNVSCDTTIISDPSFLESANSSPMLMDMMQTCHYEVQPFEEWKRHLEIADICIDYLFPYLRTETLVHCMLIFIKSLMLESGKLPIHSVISLFKLRNKIRFLFEIRDLDPFINELIFSSLMYLSVIMKDQIDDQEMYAVSELQKNLCLERRDIHGVMDILNNNIFNFGESELYHALRMMLFLIKINLLMVGDAQLVFSVVEKVNSTCQRSDLLRPLWMNILKFFHFI